MGCCSFGWIAWRFIDLFLAYKSQNKLKHRAVGAYFWLLELILGSCWSLFSRCWSLCLALLELMFGVAGAYCWHCWSLCLALLDLVFVLLELIFVRSGEVDAYLWGFG